MSPIGSAERTFRRRFLDAASAAAAAAAQIVLPALAPEPILGFESLGTFSGEYGETPLTAANLAAPLQQELPEPMRQGFGSGMVLGTSTGVNFEVDRAMFNPRVDAFNEVVSTIAETAVPATAVALAPLATGPSPKAPPESFGPPAVGSLAVAPSRPVAKAFPAAQPPPVATQPPLPQQASASEGPVVADSQVKRARMSTPLPPYDSEMPPAMLENPAQEGDARSDVTGLTLSDMQAESSRQSAPRYPSRTTSAQSRRSLKRSCSLLITSLSRPGLKRPNRRVSSTKR